MANNILPARTGELTYLHYIRKTGKIGMGDNLASLFVARVFDTLAVIGLMLLSLLFIAQSVSNIQQIIILSLAGLVLAALILLAVIFWSSRIIWLIEVIFTFLKLTKFSWGGHVFEKIQEAILSVAKINQRSLFIHTKISTIFIWFFNALIFLLIAKGFGLSLDFWQAMFLGGLPALASIVPFYTIGNFGLFEGSTTLGLLLLGVGKGIAISFGFILHITLIIIAIIPGVISYFILRAYYPDRAQPS